MVDRTKTLTPRQKARRSLILESVRFQLEENGYDGVSMRKVAEQASVSPSTLYEIYGNKEHLILQAIEDDLSNLVVEEDQYESGLERFLHRLESIANFFESNADSGNAIIKLFLRAEVDSPANKVFLANAIEARRNSLHEMIDRKQLKRSIDVDWYSRSLISVTWGAALLWSRGFSDDFRADLIRCSLSLLLPQASQKSSKRMQEVIDFYAEPR